ncbi:hypothetical protein NP233_g3921 [Leucocoprinus birnbaumii]|uniref:Uncharacterized protein n=1 Tax=Leucocoprinus birnbaumii TaxID=56174 RepID=A0AAD5YW13_9AGAR|nr:hypothetical protein NP233_g3921 [Leucocoprinus birnbaumii]
MPNAFRVLKRTTNSNPESAHIRDGTFVGRVELDTIQLGTGGNIRNCLHFALQRKEHPFQWDQSFWIFYTGKIKLSHNVPRLSCLALNGGSDIRTLGTPLNNVTSITLANCDSKDGLCILAQHRQLVEFHAVQLYCDPEPPQLPSSLRGEAMTLDNLRRLYWNFSSREWSVLFLEHFRFPNLSSVLQMIRKAKNMLNLICSEISAVFLLNGPLFFGLVTEPDHPWLCIWLIDCVTTPTLFFTGIVEANLNALDVLHPWREPYDDPGQERPVLQDAFLRLFSPPDEVIQPHPIRWSSLKLLIVKSLHLHDDLGYFSE